MIATADSSVSKAICAMINRVRIEWGKDGPVFPSSVNNRCPAIMLAANRTASVPGRIIFLIVSIHTIKGINTEGVPWGTRCANMCWVLLIHPYNINEIHSGRARASVSVKCLVLVNTYGNNPIKLLNMIIENSEININVLPLCCVVPRRVLNSLCRVSNVLFNNSLYRDGIIQNIDGMINSPINVLIQFRDSLNTLDEGSKTEKRLFIIFSLLIL